MSVRSLALAACLSLCATLAPAQEGGAPTLGIGDPAPPLKVSQFVKGEKVEKFAPGKVYVVEFWATWCGPCRATIPHLTELQKQYADKGLTVIGVDAFEDEVEAVEPFLKEMGDKMAYAVALDSVPEGKTPTDGAMARTWMDAAGQGGIPTAFLVDQKGKIAWIGHPMELDEPLEQVIAGKYDIEAAAKARKAAVAAEQKLTAFLTKVQQASKPEELKALLPELDTLIASNTELAPQLTLMKFSMQLDSGQDDAAARTAAGLLEGPVGDNAQACNNIAWTIVDPMRAGKPSPALLKVAASAAERARKATQGEDPAILDTLARTQFLRGQVAEALATQEKAVKLAGDEAGDDMKGRLEEYRKAGK